MSQTATARPMRPATTARALRERRIEPPRLRAIPTSIQHAGNGVFAMLCAVVLLVGMLAILLLNTALAKGTLEVTSLQKRSTALANELSNLNEEVSIASSGPGLARAAADLGMVRAPSRAYIDVRTGKVTGEALSASPNDAVPVISSPVRSAIPKPKAVADAEAQAAKAKAAQEAAAAAQANAAAAAKTAGTAPAGATTQAPTGATQAPKGTAQPAAPAPQGATKPATKPAATPKATR